MSATQPPEPQPLATPLSPEERTYLWSKLGPYLSKSYFQEALSKFSIQRVGFIASSLSILAGATATGSPLVALFASPEGAAGDDLWKYLSAGSAISAFLLAALGLSNRIESEHKSLQAFQGIRLDTESVLRSLEAPSGLRPSREEATKSVDSLIDRYANAMKSTAIASPITYGLVRKAERARDEWMITEEMMDNPSKDDDSNSGGQP